MQSNRKKHRYDLYSEFNQQKHSLLAHRRKIIARIMLIITCLIALVILFFVFWIYVKC